VALQGTIKDFGLADIFQLIGIQRKTGVLTLKRKNESVSIKFQEGSVVGADTPLFGVEDLLGSVLVRTGKITEDQLQEALRIQSNTLQRLGHVLVKSKFISEEELVEALRVQSLQIIYRLFRWIDGAYRFQTMDNVEYDEQHFTPINAETILMEGARMIDEWPIIQRRVKSDKVVFRHTEAAQGLKLEVESLVEADMDFEFGFDRDLPEPALEDENETEIKLSAEEREILAMVDGSLSVQDLVDRSALGEFDTHRILSELVTRNLIEEVKRRTSADVPVKRGFADILIRALLGLLLTGFVVAGFGTLRSNPLTPWQLAARAGATEQLRFYASYTRLESIEQAIQVFYLDAGVFPSGLELLAENGYLRDEDLLDPWGRAYAYHLSAGGYQVFGFDGAGEARPELTVSHRFTAAQQMLLEGAQEEPTPASE